MPSRSEYALMSSIDRNMVLFICFSSAIAFFDFLIYLYIADTVALAFFLLILTLTSISCRGLGCLLLVIWHAHLVGLFLAVMAILKAANRYY